MQKALFVLVFTAGALVAAAQTGSISGVVSDAATKEPVIGASILVQGTHIGASSDLEGKFILKNVPAGPQTIVVSFITYQTQTVSDVTVMPGEIKEVKVDLAEEARQLQEVVIRGQQDKSDELVLLRDRRKSIGMVQSIGARELSRKGVSDAEAAVTQVTGVSKQEGVKNVFIRGLGDRYNSTSMNGLPLPSEDPQLKNIALTFFATSIINRIEVNKTFNAQVYGDVAGANVNILSKDLLDDREFTLSGSIGGNFQTVGQDFYRADGNNFLGAVEKDIPVNNLSQYTFTNSLDPKRVTSPLLNHSLALSGGRSFELGTGRLNVFAVAASAGDYFNASGQVSQTNTVGQFRQDLTFQRSEYTATQFALGNIGYEFPGRSKIDYNVFYVHNNKQTVNTYRGFSINGVDDITDVNAYDNLIRRQQTNNNVLLVNQLITTLPLNDKFSLDMRGSFNTIRGNEPDRRTNFYIGDGSEEGYYPNNNAPAFNHRFFSSLKENELAANASVIYKLNGRSGNNRVVAGYNYRMTDRDFEFVQFNFNNMVENIIMDPNRADRYFNQQNLNNGNIRMETSRGFDSKALIPLFYTGGRLIHGGVVQVEYDLTPALSITAGSRFEEVKQDVSWSVSGDIIRPEIAGDNQVERNDFYVLPNLQVKYSITENDQVRLATSRTYTYPQFKEVAPFLYEDVNENVFGNPNLRPAENLNFDVKYEHYFSGDGFFAVGGFYKQITHAINMVQVNSAALEFSYLNTGNARVFGAEVEFKKTVLNFSAQAYLSAGANVSFLHSRQQLNNDPSSAIQFMPTHGESALEGAAPWLIGTDLTFNRETENSKITSALVFAYFSKRIYSLGVNGQDHIYERGVPKLDWISKIGLSSKLTLDINVRNLLNPEYQLTKRVLPAGKTDQIRSYTRGTSASIGFSYHF